LSDLYHSACPYDCPDVCAFLVRPAAGGSLEIEPDPLFPHGAGFICGKGARWDFIRKHASRLTIPLRREGPSWKRIPWGDAWGLWASMTEKSIDRWGPLSVFLCRGSGSLFYSKELIPNVFAEMGYSTTIGSLCGAAGGAGLERAFGHRPVLLPGTVADHSKGMLLWGRNAAETNLHLLPVLERIRGRGGKVGSIEVRETPSTRLSDMWWRVSPGSDGLLALLLCRVLLEKRLVPDHWKEKTANAMPFEKMVLSLDPADIMEKVGLNGREVEELALWLLDNNPVCICPGYGIQRYLSGADTFHALVALSVLLGGIDKPGGGVLYGKDEMALFPASLKKRPPVSRRLPVSSWYARNRWQPPIGVAMFCCCDPAKQSPGSKEFREAMARIPFKVYVGHFMTETAKLCDLVLPSTLFLEEGPDWRGSWWHQYVFRSSRVADPPEGVLTDLQIFSGFSEKMGVSSDLEAQRESMDRIMLSCPGLKEVSEGVYFWDEPEDWGKGARSVILPEKAPDTSINQAGLRLVSVHDRDFINGQTVGTWAEKENVPEALLSPGSMKKLGLSEGKRAIITGNGSSLEVVIRSDSGIGDCLCLMKQGIPGVNLLTSPLVSPGYGAPYHENRIEIIPVRPEEHNA